MDSCTEILAARWSTSRIRGVPHSRGLVLLEMKSTAIFTIGYIRRHDGLSCGMKHVASDMARRIHSMRGSRFTERSADIYCDIPVSHSEKGMKRESDLSCKKPVYTTTHS